MSHTITFQGSTLKNGYNDLSKAEFVYISLKTGKAATTGPISPGSSVANLSGRLLNVTVTGGPDKPAVYAPNETTTAKIGVTITSILSVKTRVLRFIDGSGSMVDHPMVKKSINTENKLFVKNQTAGPQTVFGDTDGYVNDNSGYFPINDGVGFDGMIDLPDYIAKLLPSEQQISIDHWEIGNSAYTPKLKYVLSTLGGVLPQLPAILSVTKIWGECVQSNDYLQELIQAKNDEREPPLPLQLVDRGMVWVMRGVTYLVKPTSWIGMAHSTGKVMTQDDISRVETTHTVTTTTKSLATEAEATIEVSASGGFGLFSASASSKASIDAKYSEDVTTTVDISETFDFKKTIVEFALDFDLAVETIAQRQFQFLWVDIGKTEQLIGDFHLNPNILYPNEGWAPVAWLSPITNHGSTINWNALGAPGPALLRAWSAMYETVNPRIERDGDSFNAYQSGNELRLLPVALDANDPTKGVQMLVSSTGNHQMFYLDTMKEINMPINRIKLMVAGSQLPTVTWLNTDLPTPTLAT